MTKEIIHNKLVRDSIPELIKADGQIPVYRVLSDDERPRESRKKIVEEACEVVESAGAIDEYADTLEALKAAIEADGYTWELIEAARAQKAAKRGGFALGIYLEKIIIPDEGESV
jgi:predicted house-cleaning noncanonical NTP pyrophosphatase (MazG superfamily)